jgi:hypothetical protein
VFVVVQRDSGLDVAFLGRSPVLLLSFLFLWIVRHIMQGSGLGSGGGNQGTKPRAPLCFCSDPGEKIWKRHITLGFQVFPSFLFPAYGPSGLS